MSWLDELHEALSAERDLNPERVCEVIAARWPGERLYVPSKRALEPRPDRRLTPRQIQDEYGCSHSTAHRWACRWKSRQ